MEELEREEWESNKKPWEQPLPPHKEAFIVKNLYRIDNFINSSTCRQITEKYKTKLKYHNSEIKSELYLALRKIAYYSNDLQNAFISYGPKVFEQTTEEYFINIIRNRRREIKAVKINKIMQPSPKPFKLLDCPKIRSIFRQAGLTLKQRKVFIYRNRCKKLSFAEISKRLKCNQRNAKKLYDRAVKLITHYVKRTSIDIEDIYRSPTRNEYVKLQ